MLLRVSVFPCGIQHGGQLVKGVGAENIPVERLCTQTVQQAGNVVVAGQPDLLLRESRVTQINGEELGERVHALRPFQVDAAAGMAEVGDRPHVCCDELAQQGSHVSGLIRYDQKFFWTGSHHQPVGSTHGVAGLRRQGLAQSGA